MDSVTTEARTDKIHVVDGSYMTSIAYVAPEVVSDTERNAAFACIGGNLLRLFSIPSPGSLGEISDLLTIRMNSELTKVVCDKELIACGSIDGKLYWTDLSALSSFGNVENRTAPQDFNGSSIQASCVAITDVAVLTPSTMLASDIAGCISTIDTRAGKVVNRVYNSPPTQYSNGRGLTKTVHSLALHPSQSDIIASGDAAGTVSFWDCRKISSAFARLQAHERHVWSLSFHQNSHAIYSCGDEGHCLVLNFNPNHDPAMLVFPTVMTDHTMTMTSLHQFPTGATCVDTLRAVGVGTHGSVLFGSQQGSICVVHDST